ncbi:MAG: hypothetical protein NVS3B10_06680 [Polyangiales bacterium]
MTEPTTPAMPPPDGERDLRPAFRRILRNAGSVLLGDAAGDVLLAYAVGLAALKLGRAGFGTLNEAQAFIEPFEALAGFGLRQVAITIAAREGGCDGRLRGTILGVQTGFSLVAFAIALGIAVVTGRGSILGLLLILGVSMMTTPLTVAATLPFQFEQKMHRLIFVPFVASVVRVGATWGAILLYNAPAGHQLAALAAALTTAAVTYWRMLRHHPTTFTFDRSLAKTLLLVAWPAAVLEFVVMAYVRGSYFLLHSAGPAVVGEYAAADRLVRPVLALAGALFASSLPTVAVLATERDWSTLVRLYRKAIVRILQATIPIVIAAWLLSAWLLRRFVPEYAGASAPFGILAAGAVFMFVNQLSTTFVVALGKFRLIMTVAMVNLVVYVALATQLIPRWQATGAATATAVMEVVNTCMQVVIVFALLRRAARADGPSGGPSDGTTGGEAA